MEKFEVGDYFKMLCIGGYVVLGKITRIYKQTPTIIDVWSVFSDGSEGEMLFQLDSIEKISELEYQFRVITDNHHE